MISKTNSDHNTLMKATGKIFDYSGQQIAPPIKQQYLDYLDMLKADGKEPDHTHIMQAFSVTEKHARIILQHWQNCQSGAE